MYCLQRAISFASFIYSLKVGCIVNLRACAKSRDQLCAIINKSKLLLVLFTLSTFVKHGFQLYIPLWTFFYFLKFEDIFRGSQKFYNFLYFYVNFKATSNLRPKHGNQWVACNETFFKQLAEFTITNQRFNHCPESFSSFFHQYEPFKCIDT